jgi:hypothetical protein
MSSLYSGLDVFYQFEAPRMDATEMSYCKISKYVSSLYFGLDIRVFCQFEVRVPGFGIVFSVHCTLYIQQLLGGRGSC